MSYLIVAAENFHPSTLVLVIVEKYILFLPNVEGTSNVEVSVENTVPLS